MSTNAAVGTGATIDFATTGFSAEITAINGQSITREVIDASHLGSTNVRDKILGDLADEGEVQFDFNFDPDEQPPIKQPAETITVTFRIPDGLSNGATAQGSGGITDWSWGVPLEDKMTGQGTITWLGEVTWTDAS